MEGWSWGNLDEINANKKLNFWRNVKNGNEFNEYL